MVTVRIDIGQLSSLPGEIGQENIQPIQHLSDAMPWCSSYRVLLARGHSNEESYLQSKYLRLAATYSGDKETLFQFMTQEELPEHIKVEQKSIEPVKITADIPKEEVASVHKAVEETSSDLPAVVVEMEFSSENDLVKESIEPPEQLETVESTQEIPDQISKTQELAEKADEVKERSTAGDAKKIDFDTIVTYDPIIELEPLERPIIKKEEIDFDYVAYDPQLELAKLITEKEQEEEHNFLFWLNNIEDSAPKPKRHAKSPDHVQDLLDQFLATKRQRPIQNREFYKAETKAQESDIDNMEVISETLLGLYIKQGHYTKAIEGYKKLSLQNPEKSAYFAALIKDLQHKQS